MNLAIFNEIITNGYKPEILDVFSLAAILSGILVIINKNPIVSILFLIGLFASISSYLIAIGLSFLGLSYLIVYIGAVNKCTKYAALVQIQLYKVYLILIKFYVRIIYIYPSSFETKISTAKPPQHSYSSDLKVKSTLRNNHKFYSTSSTNQMSPCINLDDENFIR